MNLTLHTFSGLLASRILGGQASVGRSSGMLEHAGLNCIFGHGIGGVTERLQAGIIRLPQGDE